MFLHIAVAADKAREGEVQAEAILNSTNTKNEQFPDVHGTTPMLEHHERMSRKTEIGRSMDLVIEARIYADKRIQWTGHAGHVREGRIAKCVSVNSVRNMETFAVSRLGKAVGALMRREKHLSLFPRHIVLIVGRLMGNCCLRRKVRSCLSRDTHSIVKLGIIFYQFL